MLGGNCLSFFMCFPILALLVICVLLYYSYLGKIIRRLLYYRVWYNCFSQILFWKGKWYASEQTCFNVNEEGKLFLQIKLRRRLWIFLFFSKDHSCSRFIYIYVSHIVLQSLEIACLFWGLEFRACCLSLSLLLFFSLLDGQVFFNN